MAWEHRLGPVSLRAPSSDCDSVSGSFLCDATDVTQEISWTLRADQLEHVVRSEAGGDVQEAAQLLSLPSPLLRVYLCPEDLLLSHPLRPLSVSGECLAVWSSLLLNRSIPVQALMG